jgi:hypothetical protein
MKTLLFVSIAVLFLTVSAHAAPKNSEGCTGAKMKIDGKCMRVDDPCNPDWPPGAQASFCKFGLGPETIGTCCKDAILAPWSSRCSEDDTHKWLTITPTGWRGIESSCSMISGKIIGREAAETKTGRTNPVYKVRAKCYTERFKSVETHTIVVIKGYLEFN